MKRFKLFFFVLTCLFIFTQFNLSNDEVRFLRYPHICNGKIAFSYHGDIWIAEEDGSKPYRLTAHVADDMFPRFSPDGKWIAFSSDRMGNMDLWLIPVSGGEPRQITFHTTGDTMLYWTPDGEKLLFKTSRRGSWYSPLYTVDLDGNLPLPMAMDMGAAGMLSRDGKIVAFNRLGFRYWRKGYRGNNNTDIWIQDLENKKITQLTDTDLKEFRNHSQDAFPMWGSDNLIYFLSERDGIFNIWKIAPNGGQPVQVTFHKKDGVQYPSISPAGDKIVYENEFRLWKLDITGKTPQPIPVSLAFDPKENLVEFLKVNSKADNFSPSPDGTNLAVDNHGEIFIIPTDPESGEKKQLTASPWRERYAEYSPNGRYLCYVSDESMEEELWLADLKSGKRKKLTRHPSLKRSFLWSEDSKELAYVANNRLFKTEAASGKTIELAHNPARGYSISSWSADGNWLSYSRSDDDSNVDIYLFHIPSRKEYNLSQNPFRDSGGLLTPDNRHIIFRSNRNGGIYNLFILSLASLKADPADPLQPETGVSRKTGSGKKSSAGKSKTENKPIKLDMPGIQRRARQLTTGSEGIGSYFPSSDGKTIYFTSRDSKGPGLFSINLKGKNRRKVVEGIFSQLAPTRNGKQIFFRSGEAIYKMALQTRKKEKLSFSFTVKVDRRKEWEQIFEESWRIMKYIFYDANMHGVDWAAKKTEYKPFLKYVGSNRDLYDLTNEMIGELNASHTGVSGPTRTSPATYQTQFPGFELVPAGEYFQVNHIYRDGPADKEWIRIRKGDYILAVDGVSIKPPANFWKVFNFTLNDFVNVTVNNKPQSDGAWTVRIKTASSLRNVKYEEWVQNNRDYVQKLSDGKIAYVHIRSMNQSSLRRFENEITQFHNSQGIVVDIRYNGGGNTDQQILDILERRPYEYWNNRWGSRKMGRRPRQAIAGPKVMLINWRSASDSEVTPMGFRDLGLGRIVGTPTYGAVIATGSYRLLNGGRIRTPGSLVVTYDPDKPNNYGINLENYGVAPDVWVENSPEDELNGFDRELKTAVDEALRMLKNKSWQYQEKK